MFWLVSMFYYFKEIFKFKSEFFFMISENILFKSFLAYILLKLSKFYFLVFF